MASQMCTDQAPPHQVGIPPQRNELCCLTEHCQIIRQTTRPIMYL